ncbi:MAG: cbb3-type cytochrome c oxidase subunit 3 [Hahellaceae bacterium]|nr:cbb3-type cytochrome c oxidase subunit 3 [Hahellaceae bacterium]
MDINTLRGISTILVMIAFTGVCWWAFGGRRKQRFDDAANLPFQDEDIAQRTLSNTEKKDHD